MDFKKYYSEQASGLDGFQGTHYQRGYGIGSLFKRFVRWVIPIIHQNAEPIVKQAVSSMSSNVSKGISNFVEDLKNKKPIGESAQSRINETMSNINKTLQTGNGKKRNKQSVKFKKTKHKKLYYKTIFD